MKKRLSIILSLILIIASFSGCTKKEEKKQEEAPKKEVTEEVEVKDDTSDEKIVAGTNQSDAMLIPLNSKVFGTVKKDSSAWFAFTTGDEEDAIYYATFVNMTRDGQYLEGALYDEYGERLDYANATSDGKPFSITDEKIEPNTTYYICLRPSSGEKDIDYSIKVKNINAKESESHKTVGNISEAKKVKVSNDSDVMGGTNANDAVLIPLEIKVKGTVKKDSSAWFAFTTGSEEGFTYNATFVNMTQDGQYLEGALYNEYGERLDYANATNDGKPFSITDEKIEPNTTYYICLRLSSGEKDIDYSLIVKSPDAKESENTLVFETPLEINETQIQFVAEKAKFVDEKEAKEVLKPVADAILENPSSTILIAGTTATDGEQKERVKLSNERAEAVKNILVETYKVPENQIKTVGLGFEEDPFERGKDRDASGKFIESEGRKNRRVVILDASDIIAQEILNK